MHDVGLVSGINITGISLCFQDCTLSISGVTPDDLVVGSKLKIRLVLVDPLER